MYFLQDPSQMLILVSRIGNDNVSWYRPAAAAWRWSRRWAMLLAFFLGNAHAICRPFLLRLPITALEASVTDGLLQKA